MNPDSHTIQEFFLDVGDGHQLYVQEWGNKKAKTPIMYLHGGPGDGIKDRDKSKFDPEVHRVIFHDQRGAGKSLPTGSLKNNTSQDLVEDITKITSRLKLKKFILTGGSWGSTLALLYAIKHPDKVAGLVIDGIFTGTKAENDWLLGGGWRQFFPDVWEEYIANVPISHRNNPGAYHIGKAIGTDKEAAKRAAYDYIKMEIGVLTLDEKYEMDPYDTWEPGGGIIEMHYLSHNCFIPENYIQDNAYKLKMPVCIIQGRYDMVCPPNTAYDLSQKLPNGKLIWTINGHIKQHEAKTVLSLLLDQLAGQ